MTEKEYNLCVREHADHIYRFVVKNLRHAEDAQDVVQSSFEKLWNTRGTVDAARAKSYLFTIAYNQMIDHIRKVKRMHYQEDIPEQMGGATRQNQRFVKEALDKALQSLTETQRSLVMLKDYEGYNYAEIGEIMGLNESQVKVYLHRARVALRNYLVKPENIL
jgi:RNA polymerase sigma-70 factor (ECF subfamily)